MKTRMLIPTLLAVALLIAPIQVVAVDDQTQAVEPNTCRFVSVQELGTRKVVVTLEYEVVGMTAGFLQWGDGTTTLLPIAEGEAQVVVNHVYAESAVRRVEARLAGDGEDWVTCSLADDQKIFLPLVVIGQGEPSPEPTCEEPDGIREDHPPDSGPEWVLEGETIANIWGPDLEGEQKLRTSGVVTLLETYGASWQWSETCANVANDNYEANPLDAVELDTLFRLGKAVPGYVVLGIQ